MVLHVLYFASVREKIGLAEEQVDPPVSVATVNDLMDFLATRSAGHASAFVQRTTIRSALDQVHVPASTLIGSAREIAFFPPVTGG